MLPHTLSHGLKNVSCLRHQRFKMTEAVHLALVRPQVTQFPRFLRIKYWDLLPRVLNGASTMSAASARSTRRLAFGISMPSRTSQLRTDIHHIPGLAPHQQLCLHNIRLLSLRIWCRGHRRSHAVNLWSLCLLRNPFNRLPRLVCKKAWTVTPRSRLDIRHLAFRLTSRITFFLNKTPRRQLQKYRERDGGAYNASATQTRRTQKQPTGFATKEKQMTN